MFAAVARTRREPRLRIQAQRHAEPVRRAQYRYRRGARQDRATPYQRAVVTFLQDIVASQSSRRENSRHLRQRQQPYDAARAMRSCSTIVAFTCTTRSTYSRRGLNQVENWFARIRSCYVIARGLDVHQGPRQKAHAIHPPVQQRPEAVEVDIRDPANPRITSDSSDSVDEWVYASIRYTMRTTAATA